MQAEMELDMNDPDAQVRMSGDAAQSASTMDIEDGSAGVMVSLLAVTFMSWPSSGAILALRVNAGGCGAAGSEGIYFWLGGSGKYNVTTDMEGRDVVKSGTAPMIGHTWSTVQLTVIGREAKGSVNGVEVFDWVNIPTVLPHHGWIAIGTPDYSAAQFDNYAIHSAS
eukprot:XP_797596.3 PREDICTED: galactocerebrosidase [Strongylocentrotus purpuratus]